MPGLAERRGRSSSGLSLPFTRHAGAADRFGQALASDGPVLVGIDEGDEARCIVGPSGRAAIAAQLPPAMRLREWVLAYSTEHHGCSLRTAHQRLADAGPTIVMVLDAAGNRFGGFATEPWRPGARYFGTGESFLFKAAPGAPVSCYHWSGANNHFQLAYHDSMAMGGGGHFGLWLDEAFEYGSSGRSDTYANEPLSPEESFRIIRVEIWELTNEGASPRTPEYRASNEGYVPPIVERAARQGSSAFLMNMIRPSAMLGGGIESEQLVTGGAAPNRLIAPTGRAT